MGCRQRFQNAACCAALGTRLSQVLRTVNTSMSRPLHRSRTQNLSTDAQIKRGLLSKTSRVNQGSPTRALRHLSLCKSRPCHRVSSIHGEIHRVSAAKVSNGDYHITRGHICDVSSIRTVQAVCMCVARRCVRQDGICNRARAGIFAHVRLGGPCP